MDFGGDVVGGTHGINDHSQCRAQFSMRKKKKHKHNTRLFVSDFARYYILGFVVVVVVYSQEYSPPPPSARINLPIFHLLLSLHRIVV